MRESEHAPHWAEQSKLVSAWGVGRYPMLDALLSDQPVTRNGVVIAPRALRWEDANALAAWSSPDCFYEFQADWLWDPAMTAIYNKSRQIGITYTTAAWAVVMAAFLGQTVTYISRIQEVSNEALIACENHAAVLVGLGSTSARATSDDRPTKNDPTVVGKQLHFASGGRVVALSPKSAGRSFSGNVVLDEFAYHEQGADKVWDAAAPVATHGYRVRVLSTPNGVGNLFHDFCDNRREGWSYHETSVWDALAAGMRLDVPRLKSEMAKGDPRLFAQMFECSFLDGSEQYIPTESVEASREDDTTIWMGTTFAGLDIGRHNDLSALVVLRVSPDNRIWVQEVETFKRTHWDDQEAAIIASANRWGWKRCCVDESGMGVIPVDRLKRILGDQRIEGVPFTLQTKEALATGLYQAFTTRSPIDGRPTLRLPRQGRLLSTGKATGEQLFLDVCSIKRLITVAGNVRYDAERTARGHADTAWGLALAIHAISFHRYNKASGGGGVTVQEVVPE